jgi:2-polyprenyl-3-methyl-5-hydroxy-6-metoxy-1,4-benzoquinol methylase
VTERARQPERLDDLTVSGPELERTLKELSRLNAWLGNAKAVVGAVQSAVGDAQEVHIVDVGCGAGDVLRALADALRLEGRTVTLTGLDGNPSTVAYARAHLPSATFQVANVMDPDFTIPPCDVMVCSHLLYHLSDDQAAEFVVRQQPQVRREIVISELVRSRLARVGFSCLSLVLRTSLWVRQDGHLAIRRSWTQAELERAMALVPGARVHRTGLFRQLLRVVGTRPT